MKRTCIMLYVALTALSSLATPTITGVTAKQRYPWNGKVDITYTLAGEVERLISDSLSVTATDNASGTTYTAASSALSGDTRTAAGAHHIVWDLNAQGLEIKSDDMVFTVAYDIAQYCVIDLSAGASASSYPVIYLAELPSGGFNTDEYKTTKLVLKLVEAGTFIMGGGSDESRRVTLTKPFYCGLFEVTQKQYELVMGSNPCSSTFYGKGDAYPVHYVSYNNIRGSSSGAQWPVSNAVDASSFLGRLRARTGLDFDLPTEAQWEYACRAGTTTHYCYGNYTNGNYMWYDRISSSQTHEVGTKQPNPWGLYDMHGNVSEWCLDWLSDALAYGTDPKGPSSSVGWWGRVLRGGSFYDDSSYCSSSYRSYRNPSEDSTSLGFRLARVLDK